MTPAPAKRLTSLPPYAFAVIGQRVREMTAQGLDVIRLDIGSPDLPPPDAVLNTLATSAHRPDRHGYAGYKGTPDFREAVARYYQQRFGVVLNPETEVLPLLGSKEGIVNLSIAYLDRDDVALVPDVGYPSYSMGAQLAGAEICWLPMRAETGYLPDLDAIPGDVLAKAKLIWVNYPNNPTGATADLDFYTRLVEFCRTHNILLASDNPYVDVTFDGYNAPSALQAPNAKSCTIEFMSFSKTYNMAGWRLGAAVGNAEAVKTLLQVKSNVDSGHFHAIYDAGITAFETPESWLKERNCVYEQRRDRVIAALPDIGLTAQTPKGSLYIWGKVAEGNGTSYAQEALAESYVCLAPGEIYGPGGTDYVRFSVGVEDDRLDEALDRLKQWYAKRK